VLCFIYRPSDQLGLQRIAGAELRARTIQNLKEVSRQHQEIENNIDSLLLFLKDEYNHIMRGAHYPDNIDSSHVV
jgi:hypothetical protein